MSERGLLTISLTTDERVLALTVPLPIDDAQWRSIMDLIESIQPPATEPADA